MQSRSPTQVTPRGIYAPLFAVIHHTDGEIDLVKLSLLVPVDDGGFLALILGTGAVDIDDKVVGDDAVVGDGDVQGGSFLLYQ